MLPKDKGLHKIGGKSVKKVIVKADINANNETIIPRSTIEASFKGSNTTSNVTNMSYMFNDCGWLKLLDVSSFDTSNVINMYNMFQLCNNLASLDVSNFDTSNVTNMGHMFDGCSSLTSLDLSKWDINNVTNMYGMFESCPSLKEIKMIGCSQTTIEKIKAQLTTDGIINHVTIVTE